MQMEIMALGMLQTNCYLLWQDGDGVIIDPGYDPARIIRQLTALNITPLAIVLTHGHFDHVGAVKELADTYGCRVLLAEPDTRLPLDITGGSVPFTEYLSDAQTLRFGSIVMDVLHTPGHSPGSVCLRLDGWLFTGDTLFRGSCGRTDLAGGDAQQMMASLRRLGALEGDFFVYPGHGEATTLERERKLNPYLREAMRR